MGIDKTFYCKNCRSVSEKTYCNFCDSFACELCGTDYYYSNTSSPRSTDSPRSTGKSRRKLIKGHDPDCDGEANTGADNREENITSKERDEYLSKREEKTRINKLFEDLRGIGYITMEGKACCNSCTIAEIEKIAESKHPLEDHDNTLQSCDFKYAFYHEQNIRTILDKADVMFNMDTNEFKGLYIGWQGQGNEIVNLAKKNGFKVDWDGSEDSKIKIY